MPNPNPAVPQRLTGLDLARYFAFVGMVVVNFDVVVTEAGPWAGTGLIAGALGGRAAATFVVLAGIGLGLAAQRGALLDLQRVTLRRARFLMVIGLLNSLIFPADILHYYAVYFLLGAYCLSFSNTALLRLTIALPLIFTVLIFSFNYDRGWDWVNYSYEGFWTPSGFLRNLFFNGWHPVIPWMSFLLLGLWFSRLPLESRALQTRLILWGALTYLLVEAAFAGLTAISPADLREITTTDPIPPMPQYMLAGSAAAAMVIGLCLKLQGWATRHGLLQALAPAGRQTLTLYIAHIVIGMGMLEWMGLAGGHDNQTALVASAIFTLLATSAAWLWARRYRRGPVEALMRRLAG